MDTVRAGAIHWPAKLTGQSLVYSPCLFITNMIEQVPKQTLTTHESPTSFDFFVTIPP